MTDFRQREFQFNVEFVLILQRTKINWVRIIEELDRNNVFWVNLEIDWKEMDADFNFLSIRENRLHYITNYMHYRKYIYIICLHWNWERYDSLLVQITSLNRIKLIPFPEISNISLESFLTKKEFLIILPN